TAGGRLPTNTFPLLLRPRIKQASWLSPSASLGRGAPSAASMCGAGHCLQCCPAAPGRFAAPAAQQGRRLPALRSPPNQGQHSVKEPWRRAMPAVKPIPDGYPSLTPYLIVSDGAAAIDFYQKAFGAKLRLKLDAPGGRIGHAE